MSSIPLAFLSGPSPSRLYNAPFLLRFLVFPRLFQKKFLRDIFWLKRESLEAKKGEGGPSFKEREWVLAL
jgi:hypothetical protein